MIWYRYYASLKSIRGGESDRLTRIAPLALDGLDLHMVVHAFVAIRTMSLLELDAWTQLSIPSCCCLSCVCRCCCCRRRRSGWRFLLLIAIVPDGPVIVSAYVDTARLEYS